MLRAHRTRNAMGRRKDEETGTERPRPALVSWKVRVADLGARLLEHARERRGPELEGLLGERAGGDEHDADHERAFEDLVCAPGSAGDGRSLVRAFAEEADGLEPPEREQLLRWERERVRGVYVLERCFPDLVEAWDPVAGARLTIHLPERLPGARAAEVGRGTLLVAVTVPWTSRLLARGRVEFWNDPRALPLYRNEARAAGKAWHDLPPPTPIPR
jgi:hypothetical protein